MVDFEQARLDPTSIFKNPDEIVEEKDLSREQKIEILRRWEYDARELEVADEENMLSNTEDVLYAIMRALHKLNAEIDVEGVGSAPNKQGGSD